MKILISNDDGYFARGIRVLSEAVSAVADITVVAPDRDKSGASNSLTLTMPLRVTEHKNGHYSVEGTPTDCVHLAVTGMLDTEFDLVVSGINAGANMGDDVIYSGTVAAAMEGRFLGLPAIAVSMASHEPEHFESAAKAVVELLAKLEKLSIPGNVILNVNVPDKPWEQIGGFQATRLGHRHRAEPAILSSDPRGRPIYWVGNAGQEQDAGPGTDFYAVNQGFVSVTPIQVDLTQHATVATVDEWLS